MGIRVVDLFAGPGGLGEGFSAFALPDGQTPFAGCLSIEKDEIAHQTLLLRSFLRQFPRGSYPDEYYDLLRSIDVPYPERLAHLFATYPEQAEAAARHAWCATLGKVPADEVHGRIDGALGGVDSWVLLGGPPCQAYSLAGRSRNKGNKAYVPEEDHRQFLYVEYLQVIADHRPAVFVMENVKGLLSAKVKDGHIFDRIIEDLQDPERALKREGRAVRSPATKRGAPRYQIYSLVQRDSRNSMFSDPEARDFVVRAEEYGVPQARHRLIILGVREGLAAKPGKLKRSSPVSVSRVLHEMPRLRSGLSKEDDSPDAWLAFLKEASTKRWFGVVAADVRRLMESKLKELARPRSDRGGEFVRFPPMVGYDSAWYLDPKLDGVCNHATRGHIVKDLYRYFFAACFAEANEVSPDLSDFPADLLPKHENVKEALEGSLFADRFRVQCWGRPSTTITSHISKDGHYYIHPDPTQCRSLTVREAARLQTFPDNYFFAGPRTAQYTQVGNAVPPLLARQIAWIVYDVLKNAGCLSGG